MTVLVAEEGGGSDAPSGAAQFAQYRDASGFSE